MEVEPIGIIWSPFKEPKNTPIQPVFAEDTEGTVEVFAPFRDGLQDLDGFDRIWLIYLLHRASKVQMLVTPFRDTCVRGVFATRAPCHPNAIGMSAVRIVKVENGRIQVAGIDVLDGTPLLDIKPYNPAFDSFPDSRAGWYDLNREDRTHADDRFEVKKRDS
jgi:tRNA-Thr(GGU) m(6)t(6)A37 methyltransferase TsaA